MISFNTVLSPQILSPALNVLTKACFGVFISYVIATGFQLEEAVFLFQLLFAQSIFITMISGSSYVKASSISDDSAAIKTFLDSQIKLAAVAACVTVAIALLYFQFTSHNLLTFNEYLITTILLVCGGIAAGFVAFLQGFLINKIGPGKVYKISVAVNIIGVSVLAFMHSYVNLVLLTSIIILVPVITACIYFYKFSHNFTTVAAGNTSQTKPGFVWLGSINTAYLIVILIFRENWQASVESSIAATVFFLLRVSDLLLQVPYLVLGGNQRLIKIATETVARKSTALIAITIIVVATVACVLIHGIMNDSPTLLLLILGQIILDLFRALAILPIIAILANRSTVNYAVLLFSSVVIPLSILGILVSTLSSSHLFIFLIMVSTVQLLYFLHSINTLDSK